LNSEVLLGDMGKRRGGAQSGAESGAACARKALRRLARQKGGVGKNSEIVAGASTCNDMRVGANAPNNGAGGIRTPVP